MGSNKSNLTKRTVSRERQRLSAEKDIETVKEIHSQSRPEETSSQLTPLTGEQLAEVREFFRRIEEKKDENRT